MIILISSKIGADDIAASLGQPEYSYYYLLKEFRPALESIGEVVQVAGPHEVDDHYRRYRADGRDVVFISFSPPQQTSVDLECPTISLLAWEFMTIPDRPTPDEPRHDWTYVLSRIAGVIATSSFAKDAILKAMGPDYPVIALPAPVFDTFAHLAGDKPVSPATGPRRVSCHAHVIDSRWHGFSANGLVRKPAERAPMGASERLRITARSVGDLLAELVKGPPATPEAVPEPDEVRAPWGRLVEGFDLDGVVYSTVLNPSDGRKNWMDLLLKFCWAFKDAEDVTLVIKFSHRDRVFYQIMLMTLLSRVEPFRCRVIGVYGYLPEADYEALVAASTYSVNTASGEGLCLPIMEAMSAAKPVVAPDHTSLADYIDSEVAFVIASAEEPACWPQDPAGKLSTRAYRLKWDSYMQALQESRRVALEQPKVYGRMAVAARSRMRAYASRDRVAAELKRFLASAARASTSEPAA